MLAGLQQAGPEVGGVEAGVGDEEVVQRGEPVVGQQVGLVGAKVDDDIGLLVRHGLEGGADAEGGGVAPIGQGRLTVGIAVLGAVAGRGQAIYELAEEAAADPVGGVHGDRDGMPGARRGQLDGGTGRGGGDVAGFGASALQVALQLRLEAFRQGSRHLFGRRLAAGGQGECGQGRRAGGEGLAAVEVRGAHRSPMRPQRT